MIKSRDKNLLAIEKMIELYCRAHHKTDKGICSDCSKLNKYCIKRLKQCKYGANKPPCSKCSSNCFMPDMKTKIKDVMVYSGPRMIKKHPIIAFRHTITLLKHKIFRQAKKVSPNIIIRKSCLKTKITIPPKNRDKKSKE